MKHFVIIGGGIAGLYLSYKLLQMGYSVLLVEKGKYLGGRMYTKEVEMDGKTLYLEGGAGVVRNDEDDVIELLKELNIPISFWKSNTKIIYHHQNKNKILSENYEELLKRVCKNATNDKTFLEVLDESDLTKEQKIGIMIGTTYSELFDTNSKDVCDENDFQEFLLEGCYKYGKPKAWKEVVMRLEEEIYKMHGKIIRDTSVVEVGNKYIKTNHNDKYSFDELIITCPYHFVKKIKLPTTLDPWKNFMNQYHQETDYLRVYSYFEEPLDIKDKIATNLPIRRVIPITNQLFMSVYTDGTDAKDIDKLCKDDVKLSRYIQRELEKLLGKKIPLPKKNWCVFWYKGISNWKPSEYSVRETVEMIRNPVKHVYFCGDTYSEHPGWIEGAMGSCEFILNEFSCSCKKRNNL